MSWSRPFDDSITLPDGRVLKTPCDVASYITTLPKHAHGVPEWRTAVVLLMLIAERGGEGSKAPDTKALAYAQARLAGASMNDNLTRDGIGD